MKTIAFYLAMFWVVFAVSYANAATRPIQMLNRDQAGNKMVYSEEVALIGVGQRKSSKLF